MKLTEAQINQIDTALGKMGIAYIDIRFELTDHVANALELYEGDFETRLAVYLQQNKKMLKRANRKMFFASTGGAYRALFKTMMQKVFISAFLAAFLIIYNLCSYLYQDVIFNCCFLVFCAAGGYASVAMVVRMFYYRRSYSGSAGLSLIVLLLLYLTLYLNTLEYEGTQLILVCVYYSFITVGSVAMLLTAEKQYKLYNNRYA